MPSKVFHDKLGDPKLYVKQRAINQKLGLPSPKAVYKIWKPSTKERGNSALKPISRYTLLVATLEFLTQYPIVTVRQIYYNLVSQQLISNNQNEYNRIEDIVTLGRLAGFIDFNSIVDDTRRPELIPTWNNIEEIIQQAILQYRSDWWTDQIFYVEVWLEKRALSRILSPITKQYGVPLCIGGGYPSWSEVNAAKIRFNENRNKECEILYFGDLDPSGKDMPRDIQRRFNDLGVNLTVEEVALTPDDVSQYQLPTNPQVKRRGKNKKDPRLEWYTRTYGIDYGVELDALPPDILRGKVEESVVRRLDFGLFCEKKEADVESKTKWQHILEQVLTPSGDLLPIG